MRRAILLSTLVLLILACPAYAIELKWSNGATNFNPVSTAPCTLLVSASANQASLPVQWRLLYIGTCIEVENPVVCLNQRGPSNASSSCSVHGPATDIERISRLTTVEFCGAAEGQPEASAAFVLSIDPTFQGRIEVVPASDMGHFAGSSPAAFPEVTVNGGTTLKYPPFAWIANQRPDSTGALRLEVTGIGLDQVNSVTTAVPSFAASPRSAFKTSSAPETLQILDQTPTSLLLAVDSPLGSDQPVVLGNSSGSVSATTASSPMSPSSPSSLAQMIPPTGYRAKDFAFIYSGGQFHIIYIRHNTGLPDAMTEMDFGHAVSTDLLSWTQLSPMIPTRPTKLDNAHVWAPTIVEQNGMFYMFYTGLTQEPSSAFQRMFVATTQDPSLQASSWMRYDAPVYSGYDVPWAFADSLQEAGSQFRDPFVMPDPATPGSLLMSFVTPPAAAHSQQIVGVAKNSGGLTAWSDLKPLWNTDQAHFNGFCESPHEFVHNGLWYLFYTTNSGHPIRFQTASSPTADSTGWLGTYRLFDEAGQDPAEPNWFASEELSVAGHDYLAYANSLTDGIDIREITWGGVLPRHFSLGSPSVAAVETNHIAASPGLVVLRRGASAVSFRISLPSPMRARLQVFDVSGRQVTMVREGYFPAGDSQFTWDGQGEGAGLVPSGIYFARLRTAAGDRHVRLAMIH